MKIFEILNFFKIFELEKVLFFIQIYPVSEGYLRKKKNFKMIKFSKIKKI
jgi:hypothetical protein